MRLSKDDLLSHLRELEVALHQPSIRSASDSLENRLHESFTEFGRSGRSYNKTEIMHHLLSEPPIETIWSQDFSVAEIADDVALLTYKSGHLDEHGKLTRHTLRSSLWLRTADGWQARFHQGTATDAFTKAAT